MSLIQSLSNEAANAATQAICTQCDGGYLRIYSGTQPADSNTAITDQVKLAELRFSSPAFAAPIDGIAQAEFITSDDNTPASGTATWFRVFKSDGMSPVFDGSVGTDSANLVLSSVALSAGARVIVSDFSFTVRKS